MGKGPGLDISPFIDPDEDSDNSDNETLDDLGDFFKHCGVVKMEERTGQFSLNHIHLDKVARKPKSDATESYEDPPMAKAA
jgi:RNA-binding protein EWS